MKARWSQWRRVGVRVEGAAVDTSAVPAPALDVAEDDPLLLHLQQNPGTVGVSELDLDSPALEAMRVAGVEVVVPLVAQGELIGVLTLWRRRSERPYNLDDRRLLDNLAGNAAAAIRVAHLVRSQEQQARARERIDQELRVAQVIQQQFLPQEAPAPEGWSVVPHYRPAREVGGDFYDFIELPDGRIAIVVGDVTDKGVPAALIMARTHSILRAEASRSPSPGAVLARANELLVPEMPNRMFVTCLLVFLEPASGRMVIANAGHNLPYVRSADRVTEVRATGMPLGLLPGVTYEETKAVIEPGSTVLLYSDGIVEAHGPEREMYGFPRLREEFGTLDVPGSDVIDRVLEHLHAFTGPGWEQEDDITMVALRRADEVAAAETATADPGEEVLAAFSVPGAIGNERSVMDRVADVVAPLGLNGRRLERLKTAVSEATMNAIEYGSLGREDVPVDLVVAATPAEIVVRITDRALSGPVPPNAEAPDIDAKLAGEQKPRGWGLFLIRNMVDQMDVASDGEGQTVTLRLARKES
jgi:serine phosphatase RsbU (regulator of sigma subunit)/anti-sigma regulatory factor (Ser/Thr protein kinase)